MNQEPPYDIRLWDELTEAEKSRYLPLTDKELALVTPMTETEREYWLLQKKMAAHREKGK